MKANFWRIAMACGCFQALQAMSNGSVRSGVGAIWVGAMSATISALTLVLVAIAIWRLPLPDTSLITVQGMKAVAGGMMGAFYRRGPRFRRPEARPDRNLHRLFPHHRSRVGAHRLFRSSGTKAKPLQARQLGGVLLAGVGLVLALLRLLAGSDPPAPRKRPSIKFAESQSRLCAAPPALLYVTCRLMYITGNNLLQLNDN